MDFKKIEYDILKTVLYCKYKIVQEDSDIEIL